MGLVKELVGICQQFLEDSLSNPAKCWEASAAGDACSGRGGAKGGGGAAAARNTHPPTSKGGY